MNANANESVAISLRRGLQVLRAFRAEDVRLSNNEIVDRTGLPKSTVARLTYTLSALGYLQQEDRMGRYRLGEKVVPLGHRLRASLPVCRIAPPLLQEFADRNNVAVALGAGDQTSMLYLVYCHGRNAVSRHLRTGAMVPIGRTAIGRAYLWGLPPARRAWHIAQIAAEAGESANEEVSTLEQSFKVLDRDGYFCAFGEWRRDIYSAAVPVILDGGQTVLGLNCSASHQAFSREHFREVLGPELVKLSTGIGNTMSAQGHSFWDD